MQYIILHVPLFIYSETSLATKKKMGFFLAGFSCREIRRESLPKSYHTIINKDRLPTGAKQLTKKEDCNKTD